MQYDARPMSSFFSQRYLRFRKAAEGGPIEADLPCRTCGYNLRGLNYGRNCPECGNAIVALGFRLRLGFELLDTVAELGGALLRFSVGSYELLDPRFELFEDCIHRHLSLQIWSRKCDPESVGQLLAEFFVRGVDLLLGERSFGAPIDEAERGSHRIGTR